VVAGAGSEHVPRGFRGTPHPLASGSSSMPALATRPPLLRPCFARVRPVPSRPRLISVGCVPFFFFPGPFYLLPCCMRRQLMQLLRAFTRPSTHE
jgi:hypothetical protein